MKKQNLTITPKQIFKRILPAIILGFIVLLVLGFIGDLQEVVQTLEDFNWGIFPLILAFTLFNYSLRFMKWHFYLGQLGVRNFPIRQSARLFVAGFPLAMTPGKVGEVLKGVWVKQMTGLPVAKGVSAIVAERISDGLAVLLLSTLGVIAYPQYWLAFLIILTILVGVIVISQIKIVAHYLLDLTERIPFIKKFTPILREFYDGSFAVFRPGATIFAVGLGMISWLGEGIGFYFLLTNLGLAPGKETLSNAIFILAFSTIIGAVTAMPGGLGAAEVSIAGMLTLLVGMEASQAAAATLLIRLATLWFGVFLGFVTWGLSLRLFGFKGEVNEFIES
jgi:uncharacterized protein (TIRG00374 family)